MWDALLMADRALGIRIASLLAYGPIDMLMVALSVAGVAGGIWILLGLTSWVMRPAKGMAVWRLLLALGLASLLVDSVVKPTIGRVRPFVGHPEYRELGWIRPTTFSFPSGHAATSAAGALALARVWPAAAVPAWTLAVLIAISRIALGVHFPSDVLAGLALGYLAARFVCARAPDPARLA